MTDSGIRWIQRFHNFQLALAQLNDAVLLSKERELSIKELFFSEVFLCWSLTFSPMWKNSKRSDSQRNRLKCKSINYARCLRTSWQQNRIVPVYKLTLWSYVRKPNNISNTPAKKPNWVNHRALQIERETLPKPKRTP